ncbi:collagen binding domain-containing protein, partial [Kurthia sibirica]
MKKQLSAALMAFMLIVQIVVSGVIMPANVQAAEAPITNDSSVPSEQQATADDDAPAEEAAAADSSATQDDAPMTTEDPKQEESNKESSINKEEKVEPTPTSIDAKSTTEEEAPKKAPAKKATMKAVSEEKAAAVPASIINTVTVKVGDKVLVKDKPNNVKIEDAMSIDYGLAIPLNTFKEGDTYTITLPVNFNTDGLEGGTINELGTYKIVGDKIVITFSKQVENENGTTTINNKDYLVAGITIANVLMSNSSNQLDQAVVIDTIEGQETYPLQFKPANVNNNMTKNGVAGKMKSDHTLNTASKAPDTILWTVTLNQTKDVLNDVVFKDAFDLSKLSLVEGSFKVIEQKIDINGKITDGDDVTADFTKQADYSWKIKNGSTKAYKITYMTTMLDLKATSYSNAATIKGDNVNQSISKTISVNRQPFMVKSGTATKTGATWKINYNYSAEELKQAVLTDEMSNLHDFDKNSVKIYPVTFDDNGNAVVGKTAIDATKFSVTLSESTNNKNKMSIIFKDTIDSAYQIQYASTLADATVDQNRVVTNTALSNGQTTTSTITNTPNSINKSVGTVDFQKQEITWKIVVNSDQYTMNNAIVNDEFTNSNLSYIDKSATVNGASFEPTKTATGLSFNLGNITNVKTIVYKTKLNPVTTQHFVNKATVVWGAKYTSSSQATVNLPGEVKNNGYKSGKGEFNSTGKYVMNWEIGFNNKLTGVKAGMVINDSFTQSNMRLVAGSLKIFEADLTSNGRGKITTKELPADYYSVTERQGNTGMDITFLKDVPANQAYIVVYQTEDLDDLYEIEYGNVVTSEGIFGKNPGDKFTWTLKPTNGGQGLSKTGDQVGKTRTFNYTLAINNSNSTLPNAVVSDQLSSTNANANDMKYLLNTFDLKVAGQKVPLMLTTNPNQLSDTNYYLYVSEDYKQFKIIFPSSINKSYTLNYSVYFEGDKGQTLDNNAQLNFVGKVASLTNSSTLTKTYVNNASTSGWGTVVYKELFVKKIDSKTGKALAGAEFNLYKEDDLGTVYKTGRTDKDGIVKFTNVRLKETGNTPYVLKEIQAPNGYMIDAAYKTGKKVEFSTSNQTITTPFQVANDHEACTISVSFKNANDKKEIAANGSFNVYEKNADGNYTPYKEMKIDFKNGKASVDLPPGDYFLKQDGKITNFTSATEYTAITVEQDEDGTCVTTPAIVELVPVCDVVILNTNKDTQAPIQGKSTFELIQNGKVIKTVTSINGNITFGQLESGDYQLKQTSTPSGYDANTAVIDFTVDADHCTTKLPNFENEANKCIITVINKDETGQVIKEGSEYKVLTKEGKVLEEKVVAKEGKIVLAKLPAGDYQLVQTKVNGIYVLNDTP